MCRPSRGPRSRDRPPRACFSRKPSASGSSRTASGARSPGSSASNAATEAKHTTAVPGTASTRQASTSRAGPDEIDGEDLPPVRHGRRQAGGVRHGAQRAELRHPGRQAGDPPGILHVEDEGLQLGSVAGGRQHVRLGGQQHLVPVDQHEDVDHVGHALGTRRAHAAGRSRHDADCHAQAPVLESIEPDVTAASAWRPVAAGRQAGSRRLQARSEAPSPGLVAAALVSPSAPLRLMARSSVPR